MGIKNLNIFLREKCKDCTSITHISQLFNKKIAVDISIYLYKYKSENTLIESFYTMLALFKEYNIIPIFIFDGKPPEEKQFVLNLRHDAKNKLINELHELNISLNNTNNIIKKYDLQSQISVIKRKIITITKGDIYNIKKMIKCFGMNYYDAVGEADELCAYLVLNEKVFAVLSEDTDMFVYGCSFVLRYFNLIHQNFILYDFNKILTVLNLSHYEFSYLCIFSGSDYNPNDEQIHDINKLYNDFKTGILTIPIQIHNSCNYGNYGNYGEYGENIPSVEDIYNKFFNLKYGKEHLKLYNDIIISNNFNNKICYTSMQTILESDGFVFPEI